MCFNVTDPKMNDLVDFEELWNLAFMGDSYLTVHLQITAVLPGRINLTIRVIQVIQVHCCWRKSSTKKGRNIQDVFCVCVLGRLETKIKIKIWRLEK